MQTEEQKTEEAWERGYGLCIILPLQGFNYHQLALAFYMASYAISSKLHFTLHHDYCEKLLPPTPDTLHLGCSYHLCSSHHFLFIWGAVMLKKI